MHAQSPTSAPARSDLAQRACDLAVALAMSAVAAPLVAAAWVVVRLTSAGPGFNSQVRVGRGGRTYRIYKIRTMSHNCEAATGAAWCAKRDPRVTPVGRVLRKLHLDELPQLWNVLRGGRRGARRSRGSRPTAGRRTRAARAAGRRDSCRPEARSTTAGVRRGGVSAARGRPG